MHCSDGNGSDDATGVQDYRNLRQAHIFASLHVLVVTAVFRMYPESAEKKSSKKIFSFAIDLDDPFGPNRFLHVLWVNGVLQYDGKGVQNWASSLENLYLIDL